VKSIQDEVMSCEAFVELVTEYLEEAVTTRERASFEQHMHFCEGCVTHLEQIRATARLVAAPREEATIRPDTLDALVAVFRKLKPPEHS
jgi:hypothetical protein